MLQGPKFYAFLLVCVS